MCTRAIGGGTGAGGGTECVVDKGALITQRTKRQQMDAEEPPTAASDERMAAGNRIRDRNGFRRRAAAFCARLALSTSPCLNGFTTIGNDCGPTTVAGCDAAAAVLQRWAPNLGALEVLMVSGRTAGDDYWVLPGGGVENMESTEQAVIRELCEEAGIRGKVLFCIGEFVDTQRFHHTTLFFLTVREVFTEWGENCENGRQRRWMGMDEARQSIKHNQRDMLERSIKIIERTLGDQLEPAVSKWLSAAPVVSLRAAEDGIPPKGQAATTTEATPTATPSTDVVVQQEEAVTSDGATTTTFDGQSVQ